MPTTHSTLTLLAAFAALGGLFSSVNAQSVATKPVGAVTTTIAAGTGTTRVVTNVSFPLIEQGAMSGAMTGTITGVTANTITNSAANWGPGLLSAAAAPHIIAITSGTAAGRYLTISTTTANTATTVTLDAEDAGLINLTSIGLQAGDSYSILRCDTLGSLFPDATSLGVVGGTATTGAGADLISLQVSGSVRQYYYGTNGTPGWRRVGPGTASNNVLVRPDALVIYSRIGNTALPLTITGSVVDMSRKVLVRNTGVSNIANPFPSGTVTLASSLISDTPAWLKGANAAGSDLVQFQVSGSIRQYYHNGTNWRRVGPNTISDTVQIPAGAGVQIVKKGAVAGSTVVSMPLPYTL